jgi:orotidine-5'-phosphate decarboxylase
VGIDPHPYLLDQWKLSVDAVGAREFGLRVVEAVAGTAGIVKPQVAFFERFGSAGYRALEDVLAACRAAGILVIADAKRGDVGSTVEAYASAWLTPGAPLEADAMTISAYQGLGSIADARTLAISAGKGLFVLSATSNAESFEPQRAIIASGENTGDTVAGAIINGVAHWNTTEAGLGSIGVVVGATISLEDYGIESAILSSTPILAPGFGHQGALYGDIRGIYGASADNVLVSASRSILAAGPGGIAQAIRTEVDLIAKVYA